MMVLVRHFLYLFLIFCAAFSNAQETREVIASVESYHNRFPVEKLYLHHDKPYYVYGDTIWFKAYLFDAVYLDGSSNSGLLYVEAGRLR